MAIKLFPNKETQIRIAEAIENLNITGGADLTPIEEEISDIKADYVTKIALDLQLLEKQGIRPNGTDLLIIDGKVNSKYIDSLYVTDIEVVETVSDMLLLQNMKRGDIVIVTSTETTYILKEVPSDQIENWATFLSKPEVISVNGKTGVVVLGISDIDNLQDSLNSKLDVSVYEDDKLNKQDKLTAGNNITIDPDTNVISASGGTEYVLTKSKIDSALRGYIDYTLQLGLSATAPGFGSTALGHSARSGGDYAVAIGDSANTSKASAIAIGRNAKAQGLNSIAIGRDTIVTEDNVADFGSNRQVRVNETPVNDRDAVSKKYVDNKDTIKEQNNNTDIMFWNGTQAEYDSLSVKDENTIYFIKEE